MRPLSREGIERVAADVGEESSSTYRLTSPMRLWLLVMDVLKPRSALEPCMLLGQGEQGRERW